MATKKISELQELETLNNNDLIPVVDTENESTKKVTFRALGAASSMPTGSIIGYDGNTIPGGYEETTNIMKTIWTGNLYTKQSSTSIGTSLESGRLYAFVVKGNSSIYLETIPFIFTGDNTLVQHVSYEGTTVTRWRIGVSSNSFILDNNSLNIVANTAVIALYVII